MNGPESTKRRRVSARHILLLLEAGVLLASAKCLARLLPFRILARGLGRVNGRQQVFRPCDAQTRSDIGWALRAIGRRIRPLEQCLTQATAARWMLGWRRFPTTLYLGVQKDSERPLRAHAWLCAGDVTIVGGENRSGYEIIAKFTS